MEEDSIRKVELTENDFKLIIDIKHTMEATLAGLLNKLNQVLDRHTIRDPAWKGQVVPFEAKRLVERKEGEKER